VAGHHAESAFLTVIPAQAGIQVFARWIPACAGMTGKT
jgi:hypothetical protein